MKTFSWAQHQVSAGCMAEVGGAGDYILTLQFHYCCAGHSDNVHPGLMAWVKTRYLPSAEGYLTVTIVELAVWVDGEKGSFSAYALDRSSCGTEHPP